MCTTKAPKPVQQTGDEKKPVQYLSNPWVDGLGVVGENTRGRNSLRIDPGTPRRPVTAEPPPVFPPVVPPTPTSTPTGGGGRGATLPPWRGGLGINNRGVGR
jgi:hypothetical protein